MFEVIINGAPARRVKKDISVLKSEILQFLEHNRKTALGINSQFHSALCLLLEQTIGCNYSEAQEEAAERVEFMMRGGTEYHKINLTDRYFSVTPSAFKKAIKELEEEKKITIEIGIYSTFLFLVTEEG